MKKSILKKIVSVFAVATILVAGSTVALADYECASQSSDCSASTNWEVGSTSPITGATHVIENGALKSERTIFYSRSAEKYGFTVDGNAAYLKADTDGKWTTIAGDSNTKTIGSTYAFADGQTFSKGKFRAEFDFKFEGGDGQSIYAGIKGSTTTARCVGVRISKEHMAVWYPTEGDGNPYYYSDDRAQLETGVWYTCTLNYDIDKKYLSVAITGNGTDFSASETITEWGDRVPGEICGMRFFSYYDRDAFGTTDAPEPASSVWYIDNVEIDAGVGYKAESVYSDGNGLVSNATGTGLSLAGIKLSALTRIAVPETSRFITATYDTATGRMKDVTVKTLSEATASLITHAETADTVKSFVLDMNTATPYMEPYEYQTPETTERKIDFDGDYPDSVKTVSPFTADAVHAYEPSAKGGHTMSIVSENGNRVLKSERTKFHPTGTSTSVCYNSTKKAFEVVQGDPGNGYYRVALDKDESSIKGSFKIKFAGTDYASGQQDMQVNLGTIGSSPSQYYLRVTRNADGSGALKTNYYDTIASFEGMKANEWYTVEFEYTGGKMNANITGIFGDNTSETTVNGTAMQAASSPVASFNYVAFGSHRDLDTIVGFTTSGDNVSIKDTAVEGGTNTSVYYIDDIVLEY